MANKAIYIIVSACLFFLTNSVAAEVNTLSGQLARIQQQTGIRAVAYALVEKNKILATGGIGSYSLNSTRPVTETSLFRIGSITKTFTSMAVMRLVEQGKLQLDQPIKTLAPDLPLHNPWPATPVTLAMLLEHTSGLQDMTREEFNYPRPLSLQAALDIKSKTRQLHWPPGYHSSYSNLGAGYVGRVIEIVTGENYDDWFEREILSNLGMQDSRLQWTSDLEQNLVTGYDADLKTKIPYWHTLFRPFGGLNSTASDMAKFLLLFTAAPDAKRGIVSALAINRMETPESSMAARAGLKTGYGLGIRNSYFNGHKLYGHGGDGDGYLAEFAYSKESQRAYFVVINAFRHDLLEEFTNALNHWLIEQLPTGADAIKTSTEKHLSAEQRLALAGEYREVAQRFPFKNDVPAESLRINNSDSDLFRCISITTTNKCKKILPVTEALFRNEDESHASMAFVKASDGNFYLLTSFGSYKKTGGQ